MNSKAIICVVDDDTSILRAMTRLLSSVGLLSIAFSAPKDFIEYAKDHALALVVLDISMPEINGLEVFNLLSQRVPLPPIIFISGTQDETCRDNVMSKGAVAFFTKPFKEEVFLAAIKSALHLPHKL